MKTIRFTYGYDYGLHRCTEPGDYSGEYVKAEVARALLAVVEELASVKRAGVGKSLMKSASEAIQLAKAGGKTNEQT